MPPLCLLWNPVDSSQVSSSICPMVLGNSIPIGSYHSVATFPPSFSLPLPDARFSVVRLLPPSIYRPMLVLSAKCCLYLPVVPSFYPPTCYCASSVAPPRDLTNLPPSGHLESLRSGRLGQVVYIEFKFRSHLRVCSVCETEDRWNTISVGYVFFAYANTGTNLVIYKVKSGCTYINV